MNKAEGGRRKAEGRIRNGGFPVHRSSFIVHPSACPLSPIPYSLFPRSGITLLELLVVISILMLLMIVALPAMTPTMEGRRIREAARAINVYLGAARNHAMERGHPVGVILARMSGTPQACMTLHEAEVPPPYAGDSLNARLQLSATSSSNSAIVTAKVVIVTAQGKVQNSTFSPGLIAAGDEVHIDQHNTRYQVTKVVSTSRFEMQIPSDLRQGQTLPWTTSTGPVPFEVIRQPMQYDPTKKQWLRSGGSMAVPLTLPAGAVIDLQFSGTDNQTFHATDTNAIIVMFSPNGAVGRIYCCWTSGSYGPYALSGSQLYLLVGRRERVNTAVANAGDVLNWRDLNNLWITVTPQTGLVAAKENAVGTTLAETRQFARTVQGVGGR